MAVGLGPGADVARARRGRGLGRRSALASSAGLAGVPEPWRERVSQVARILRRKVDLVLGPIEREADRLVGGSTVVIVFENDLHSLCHPLPPVLLVISDYLTAKTIHEKVIRLSGRERYRDFVPNGLFLPPRHNPRRSPQRKLRSPGEGRHSLQR